jgi:hypothetical protein
MISFKLRLSQFFNVPNDFQKLFLERLPFNFFPAPQVQDGGGCGQDATANCAQKGPTRFWGSPARIDRACPLHQP